MPDFRVTWEFQESNGATFNEVFYVGASSPDIAATPGTSILRARLGLLQPLNQLNRVRATQVDAARVTGFTTFEQPGQWTPGLGLTDTPVAPGLAAVCVLTDGTRTRRVWLRGCGSTAFFRDAAGRDQLSAPFMSKLNSWFRALSNQSYALRVLTPQTGGILNNTKILQVDGTANDGTSLITLSQAQAYPFPGRVIIGGASRKDLPALNGRWQLLGAPVGSIVHVAYQTPLGGKIMGGNAHMRQELYQALKPIALTQNYFADIGTRTTRVPLTHSRGARRAARIRTSP